MNKKAGAEPKQLNILVIADQERLLKTFELSRDIPAVRLRMASSIDEGIKAAAKSIPALLFVQSRISGLSGEIIVRHIRLELKERKTKIVLLCNPADMPVPGSKSFFATIDTSLPDDQLADRVLELVTAQLPGGTKPSPRVKSAVPHKTIADNYAPPSPAPEKALPEPDREVVDIVEIRASVMPAGRPRPAEDQAQDLSFREKLDRAMENTASTAARENMPDADREIAVRQPAYYDNREEQPRFSPAPPASASPRGWRIRLIVPAAVLLLGAGLLLVFRGLPSAPDKTGQSAPGVSGEGSPTTQKPVSTALPAGSGSEEPETREPAMMPMPAAKQMDGGDTPAPAQTQYLEYTVRRGDTLFTILTKRFGLSTRMAESLIPEILEINGISRNTTLRVGRKILIPGEVKIRPAP